MCRKSILSGVVLIRLNFKVMAFDIDFCDGKGFNFKKVNAPLNHDGVMSGKVCAYCGKKTILRKTEYGWQWACLPCGAWVGCHRGTSLALGRVANSELRRWKMAAHDWFDPLWKSGGFSRRGAYTWLAKNLGLTVAECHIGMFDVATCEKVVKLAKAQLINQIEKTL